MSGHAGSAESTSAISKGTTPGFPEEGPPWDIEGKPGGRWNFDLKRPLRPIRATAQATLATTKMNLAAQNSSQYSSTTSIKITTNLWPCTCHPKLLSKLSSTLVLSLRERVLFESCSKTRCCAHNNLVTSHVTVTHIPMPESYAGHILSHGH